MYISVWCFRIPSLTAGPKRSPSRANFVMFVVRRCTRCPASDARVSFTSIFQFYRRLFIFFFENLSQIVYVSKLADDKRSISLWLLISSILISVCDYFIHEHCQVIILPLSPPLPLTLSPAIFKSVLKM